MENTIQYLQLAELVPSDFHPHLETNDSGLNNLINSISHYGILEPLVVRPKDRKFEVVLGNRRYNAANRLKLDKVPVKVLELSDKEALEMIISENIHRKELTSREEGALYEQALSYSNYNME